MVQRKKENTLSEKVVLKTQIILVLFWSATFFTGMDKQQYTTAVTERPTVRVENNSSSSYPPTPELSQPVMQNVNEHRDSSHQRVQLTMGGSSMFCPPQTSGYISYPNHTTIHYPSNSCGVLHSPSNQSSTM